MTDIQAALGKSQLTKLDSFISRRHELANIYNEYLLDLPLKFQINELCSYSGMHLYVVRLKNIKKSRMDIFETLRENKIGVNVHYIPIHLQPFYKQFGFKEGDYPEAELYYKEAISLPIYPDLKDKEITKVIDNLRLALE
jgi:dTDP-4-amino-4,6-dideoxygalactose transaminase